MGNSIPTRPGIGWKSANIVPIVDGKLSYKKIFCGANKYEYRQRTLELHDAFAEVNKKWGLERGDSVNITKAKHRSTEEYRRELSSECSTLERNVEEKSATLKDLNKQLRDAKLENESLNREVQSARADVSQIALNKISSEALWSVLNEFVRIKPGISPEFSEHLEDSLLEDMSQKEMNIIASLP